MKKLIVCFFAMVCWQLLFGQDPYQTDSIDCEEDSIWNCPKSFFKYSDCEFTPRFCNYYEISYGFGLSEFDHYIGFSYTHTPERVGIHTSVNWGVNANSISVLAGPTYSFKLNDDGTNLQAYCGLGGTYRGGLSIAAHGGVRYCMDKGSLSNTETMSITAGLSYLNNEIVPTFGISIIPAALQMEEWWGEKVYSFPHHYSELTLGYGVHQFMIGANYTYIPSRIGMYTSGLLGFDMDWGINIGPALRLIDPEDVGVDIIAFQGFGIFNDSFGGETGIRFGFGDDMKYGLWSLSASMGYSKYGVYGMFGMSWPIAAYVGTVAVMVGYAAALIMGGGDVSDASNVLPDWSTSGSGGYSPTVSNTPDSPSVNTSNDIDKCYTYKSEYDKSIEFIKYNILQSYVNDGSGYILREDPYTVHVKQESGNMTPIKGSQSTLRKKQEDMRKLRERARRAGCIIERSPYEGARISVY